MQILPILCTLRTLPWQPFFGFIYIWVHIGATWRIRLNRLCAAAMWPYVKLLWPFVETYVCTVRLRYFYAYVTLPYVTFVKRMPFCPSVISRCPIKTAKHIVTQTSPHGNLGTPVFGVKDPGEIPVGSPQVGAKYTSYRKKIATCNK